MSSSFPEKFRDLISRRLRRNFLSSRVRLKFFHPLQDKILEEEAVSFTKQTILTITYSAGLLASAMAVAETDPASFQAEKDRQIANVLEKVQIAQKNLSCVQAAQDHADLKACDEVFKQSNDASDTKGKEQATDKKTPKPEK